MFKVGGGAMKIAESLISLASYASLLQGYGTSIHIRIYLSHLELDRQRDLEAPRGTEKS